MDDLITYRARIGMFSMNCALKSFKVKQNKYSGKSQVTIRRKKSPREGMPNITVPTKSTTNVGHISFYILFILCLIISGLDTCPLTRQRLLPDMTGWTSSSVFKIPCDISFVPQPEMATYVVFNCSCDPLLGNAGIHSYNGNPRTHSSSSQASADQGLHNLLSVPELHFEMVDQLNSSFKQTNTSLWNKFKFALKWKTMLPEDVLDKAEDMFFVSNLLEEHGEISPGSYTKLKECLVGNKECLDIINNFEYKMSRMASYCDQGQVEQRPTSNQVVGNSAEGNERFPSQGDRSNSTVSTGGEMPTSILHEGLVTSSLSRDPKSTAFPHEGPTGGPLTTTLPNEGQLITCFPIERHAATIDPTEEPMIASYPVERPISSTVPEDGPLTASVSKEGLVANIDPTQGQTTNTVSTEGQIATSVLTERHITPSISHEPMDTSVSHEEKMTTTVPTEEPMTTSFLKGGPMINTVSIKGQITTSVPTELPITSCIPNRGHMPTAVATEGPIRNADSNEGQKTTGVPTERPVATAVPIEEQITTNLSSEGQMAMTVPAGGLMATAVPSEGNQLPLTVDLHQTFQQTDIQQTQFTRLEPRIKVQHAQTVFTGDNNVVYYGTDIGDQNDQANNIQQQLEGIEQTLQERKVQESNYQDTLKSTQHKCTEIIYDRANSIQTEMQNTEQRLAKKVSDHKISTDHEIKSTGQQLTETVNKRVEDVQKALEGTEERLTKTMKNNKTGVQHILASVEEIEREFRNTTIKQTALLEKLGCASKIDNGKQANIIAQTEAWISNQRKTTPFLQTKAFEDARKKLCKSKVLIVKGNSGDGKTHLALALLAWLIGEEYWKPEIDCSDPRLGEGMPSKKKPLHLKSLKLWDEIVTPNSQLAIFVDDLFGYDFHTEKEMGELKKCENYIIPGVQGDLCESANCIIMTVRNDIYLQYLESFSRKEIFCTDNIIDLSTTEYSLEQEKKQLLLLYTPKSDFEHFSEAEIYEIARCSPNLGFPECCRIFLATAELHQGRVEFFRNPLIYIRDIIRNKFSKDKQLALLYLLYNGTVRSGQLEPGNDNVDLSVVEKVFNLSLSRKYEENTIDKCMRLQYIKGGLDALCDSFVKLEKGIYRFFHSSVCDAIAILFGEISPQNFLQNCDIRFLRYIATSKGIDKSCKVVIEEDIFQCAFRRISYELSFNDTPKSSVIASLIPWDDTNFTDQFLEWIEENRSLSKDFHLNQDISSGGTENSFSFIVYVSKYNKSVLLKRLLDRCSDSDMQMKFALDMALAAGSETCAKILLGKGVKPDAKSCFDAIKGAKLCLLQYLDKQVNFLTARSGISDNNDTDMNLLIKAVVSQKLAIVKWLVKKYQSLLYCSMRGINILHIAAGIGNTKQYEIVAEALLRGKSRQECLAVMSIEDGATVLHLSCFSGHTELCMHLCNTCPYLLTQRDTDNLHCLHYAAMSGSLRCYQAIELYVLKGKSDTERERYMITLTGKKMETVLHLACAKGSEKVCTHLCKTYPSLITQRDALNKHCLHYAASSDNISCYHAMESLVLEGMSCKTREQYMTTLTGAQGNTVLHTACVKGNTEMCMYLCKIYPSLMTKKTAHGIYCLHLAAFSVSLSCYQGIESLVFNRISVEKRKQYMKTLTDMYERTVLHWACLGGRTDQITYLSHAYPSLLTQRDAHNSHCLHYAAYSGDIRCYKAMESLVLDGMPCETREQYMTTLTGRPGNTVLHTACVKGNREMCMYLCKMYPSLMTKKTAHGLHCLHLAASYVNLSCYQAIESLVLNEISVEKREQHMQTLTDTDERTVLQFACSEGRKELCMHLSNTYPSLMTQKDAVNTHCLHNAAESGNLNCYKAMESLVLKVIEEDKREQYMATLTDMGERTVLHGACSSGSEELCMHLCNTYPSLLTKRDAENKHCLHYASGSGNLGCFKIMEYLALNVDLEGKRKQYKATLTDIDERTVLHLACSSGSEEICMYLSDTYPFLMKQTDAENNHCLHYAALSGKLSCYKAMESLVLKSIVEDKREQYMATLTNVYKHTVLHEACSAGSQELGKYLCNKFPVLIEQRDSENKHCLHYASGSGNLGCYKTMESLALNVHSEGKRKQCMATLRDIDKKTVLHLACSSGSEEICIFLSNTYPFLMKQTDAENNHCLHYAALSGKLSCYKAMESLVLKIIVEEKREQYMATLTNVYKHTVLHKACSAGSQELCKYLCNTFPVLIEQRDSENKHCLHYASGSGNLGCYKTMESLALNVHSEGKRKQYKATLTDIDKNTVLHLACSSGSEEICMYLSNTYPFLMKQTDAENNHCLHYAALSGNLNCYKVMESLVLKNIAEEKREQYMSTLTNVYKHTVLHGACAAKSEEMCMYLCNTYPSLMKQRDASNNHCLHYAAMSGKLSCYKAMESLVLKNIAEEKREQYMSTLTNMYKHTVLHKAYLSRNKDLCVYLCKTYPSLMLMMNARFVFGF